MIEEIINLIVFGLSSIPITLITIKIFGQIKKHPYSVEAIFLAAFVVFYFLDTLYSITQYSDTFTISGVRFFFDPIHLAALSLYYSSAAAIFLIIVSKNSKQRNLTISKNIRLSSATISHPLPLNLSRILIYASVLWLAGTIYRYGFAEYFQNLAVRTLVFSDTTTENALISSCISIYSLIISCRYASKPNKRKLLIDSIPLIAAIILTGARATLVEFAFIFLFINNYHSNTFKLNKKVVIIFAVAAIALTQLAMNTRIHSDTDTQGMIATVFETEQVPQSENGLNIIEENAQKDTIVISLLAFVPRALLEAVGVEKGYGANADYTETFIPYRWIEQNSQISLGGLNELLYNGNAILALFAILLIAIFTRVVLKKSSKSRLLVLLTPAISWAMFQFLRGDLYHTTNKFFTYLTALLVFAAITKIVLFLKISHKK